MKKLFFYATLGVFISFIGFSSLYASNLNFLGGGNDVFIVHDKQGNVEVSFSLPDDFTDELGKLLVPISLVIVNNSQETVLELTTLDGQVMLPNLPKGIYKAIINIGNVQQKEVFSF